MVFNKCELLSEKSSYQILPEPTCVHNVICPMLIYGTGLKTSFLPRNLTLSGGHTDVDIHKELKNKIGKRHEK